MFSLVLCRAQTIDVPSPRDASTEILPPRYPGPFLVGRRTNGKNGGGERKVEKNSQNAFFYGYTSGEASIGDATALLPVAIVEGELILS
jgi:hypothetical protein